MTSSNTTTTTNLPPSGTFSSFHQSFIPNIQTLELILPVSIFIIIHSLRQRHHLGLASWPVIGMLPSLFYALSRENVYEWLTDVLVERSGTFTFRGPWFTSLQCVLTSDPRNLEHLLKTKFNNFPKGPFFRNTVRDLLGDGIFGVDDESWKRQRRTASIEFHSARFRDMTVESLYTLVHSRLLPVLESAYKEKREIDMQDVLLRLTFDNVCIIAFGTDPGCLAQGLPEVPFARAFEEATEATIIRFVTPTTIWHTCRFLNIGNERRLKTSLKVVDKFAYKVIKNRRKELALEGTKGKSDLLTVFIGLKDEDGKDYSGKFLRDICVNFILAGRDTSSVALAWFFWLLDKNRDVEEKIVEEVRKIVKEREGDGRENANGDVMFKPEEIKKMEYLQAALSEALRLYPSVPVDHKEVVDDEVFPDGTVLKGGTKIIYAIYTMGRMESIWGKDCRDYKPERWLKDGRFMSESAYKFTAFNGGPRLCLGKDFAYYQMKYVTASILSRYHVKVVENHPVAPKLALTMYMKHGLKVTLEKRET